MLLYNGEQVLGKVVFVDFENLFRRKTLFPKPHIAHRHVGSSFAPPITCSQLVVGAGCPSHVLRSQTKLSLPCDHAVFEYSNVSTLVKGNCHVEGFSYGGPIVRNIQDTLGIQTITASISCGEPHDITEIAMKPQRRVSIHTKIKDTIERAGPCVNSEHGRKCDSGSELGIETQHLSRAAHICLLSCHQKVRTGDSAFWGRFGTGACRWEHARNTSRRN